MKLRILITAGPTREFLDPIRFISNRSSGKMGYALAEAASAAGMLVTLVSGPVALTPPKGVTFVPVTTAQEMGEAVLKRFANCDVVIMTAAVCDFRPKRMARLKIKKQTFTGALELVPTMDILLELGKRKKLSCGSGIPAATSRREKQNRGRNAAPTEGLQSTPYLVGFAAETDNLVRNACEKLQRKGLDLIVANDASAMEADTNKVILIGRDGEREELPEMSKKRVAQAIIRRVKVRQLAKKAGG